MQNFIKNHPNSIYTGNAYFWLAEFHLATDPVNYNEARKTTILSLANIQTLARHLEHSINYIVLPKMSIRILYQLINTKISYLLNILNLKKLNSLKNNLGIKKTLLKQCLFLCLID